MQANGVLVNDRKGSYVGKQILSSKEARSLGLIVFQNFLRISTTALTIIYTRGNVSDAVFLTFSIVINLITTTAFLYNNLNRKKSTQNVKLAVDKLKGINNKSLEESDKEDKLMFILEVVSKFFAVLGATIVSFLYKKRHITGLKYYLSSLFFLLIGSISVYMINYDRQEFIESSNELLKETCILEKIAKKDYDNLPVIEKDSALSKICSPKVYWACVFLFTVVGLNATSMVLGVFYASGKIKDGTFLIASLMIGVMSSSTYINACHTRRKASDNVKKSLRILKNIYNKEEKQEESNEEKKAEDMRLYICYGLEITAKAIYIIAPFLYKKAIISSGSYYCLLILSTLIGSLLEFNSNCNRIQMSEETKEMLTISDSPEVQLIISERRNL